MSSGLSLLETAGRFDIPTHRHYIPIVSKKPICCDSGPVEFIGEFYYKLYVDDKACVHGGEVIGGTQYINEWYSRCTCPVNDTGQSVPLMYKKIEAPGTVSDTATTQPSHTGTLTLLCKDMFGALSSQITRLLCQWSK